MKFAKSILMGTGAVVLAGLILALLAPKAAHAIVAAAVLVTNTAANPVPTQSIMPGKPFQWFCASNGPSCTFSPPVPIGYTFVAQQFNANIGFKAAPAFTSVAIQYQTQGQNTTITFPITFILNSQYINESLIAIYPDAASTGICFAADEVHANVMQCSLTGYLSQ
jgi:hypothetical protein